MLEKGVFSNLVTVCEHLLRCLKHVSLRHAVYKIGGTEAQRWGNVRDFLSSSVLFQVLLLVCRLPLVAIFCASFHMCEKNHLLFGVHFGTSSVTPDACFCVFVFNASAWLGQGFHFNEAFPSKTGSPANVFPAFQLDEEPGYLSPLRLRCFRDLGWFSELTIWAIFSSSCI